ncbi:MAG: ATP-binding cassette domain-containing protein [Alphaproteobacteria bacterium]|nr:ATP-binding cassette domain-containing protein [Alphaproteobacteria bacterium]MCL2504949.1 ATP-binding cassette domain-containing protein [Alphaproteobacteria bacterium]
MILSFQNTSLMYPPKSRVLENIQFSVEEGGFCFIFGDNCSGKTSLMKLIYEMQKPTTGTVSVFDESAAKLNSQQRALLRRKIGVVSQQIMLFPQLTVFENIALPLKLEKTNETFIMNTAKEALKTIGYEKPPALYPGSLSLGEQQLISFARAIANKPRLLLADDPFMYLDKKNSLNMLKIMENLNDSGTTILITSVHNKHVEDFAKRSKTQMLTLSKRSLSPYDKI